VNNSGGGAPKPPKVRSRYSPEADDRMQFERAGGDATLTAPDVEEPDAGNDRGAGEAGERPDRMLAEQKTIAEVAKEFGVPENTYPRWCNQDGGMKADVWSKLGRKDGL
jgi:hypothetical protein